MMDLRGYQQRITTFLYERDAALCIARPGAGKTAPALTALRELLNEGVIRHALVIAPKRVARNVWPEAIGEWEHLKGLRYSVLTGGPEQRAELLDRVSKRDLTIVGIDILPWLLDEIATWPDTSPMFDMIVIDEISKLRNPRGVRAKAIAKVIHRWHNIWGMSGTLRPNSALDLFMPGRLVSKGALWGRSFDVWQRKHFYPADYNGYDWQPLPEREAMLNAQLAPYCITLADNDMPSLPRLSVILDYVDLPSGARRHYDTMERQLLVRLDTNEKVLAANAAVAVGKLSQLANGFIYHSHDPELAEHEQRITTRLHDAKREWLEDVIDEATAPMLLIYDYIEDLALMQTLLGEDLPYLGQGVTDRRSDQAIADWNAGKLPFLALHPASGGHGLNLQHGGADMVWIGPTWSPELWEQTIARLHRSGQVRPVMVRVCMARDTIDDAKRDRVLGKMSAQAAFEAYLRRRQRLLA